MDAFGDEIDYTLEHKELHPTYSRFETRSRQLLGPSNPGNGVEVVAVVVQTPRKPPTLISTAVW